jgi:hypothetical protein
MDRVRELTAIAIKDIQKYLADCSQNFEPSQLYSTARNEKFVDESVACSSVIFIIANRIG